MQRRERSVAARIAIGRGRLPEWLARVKRIVDRVGTRYARHDRSTRRLFGDTFRPRGR
jgi:hypothetical protein